MRRGRKAARINLINISNKQKKKTMKQTEVKKMLSELEAQGWNPQLCDTPMACFDNAVACGKPAGVATSRAN